MLILWKTLSFLSIDDLWGQFEIELFVEVFGFWGWTSKRFHRIDKVTTIFDDLSEKVSEKFKICSLFSICCLHNHPFPSQKIVYRLHKKKPEQWKMSFMSFHDIRQCLISLFCLFSPPTYFTSPSIYCLAFKCKHTALDAPQTGQRFYILSDRVLMTLHAKAIFTGQFFFFSTSWQMIKASI